MSQGTIGDRIKSHRKRLGLTQEQLAERLSVSPQAVSKWENNLSCPDISVLPELASIFGITVDELLGKETVRNAEIVADDEDEEDEDGGKSYSIHLNGIHHSGLLFALFVITVGALLLVNRFCEIDIGWWTVLWTCALTYIGISGLCGGFSMFSLVATLLGLYFLLSEYFPVINLDLNFGTLIAIALVIWGISLVLDILFGKKHKERKFRKYKKMAAQKGKKLHHDYNCTDGYLHCDLSFGEYRAAVVTSLLRGGSVESSFGDFTVDFSACEAIDAGCRLKVENSFGSLTLLVPEKYTVRMEHDQSFASVNVKGEPSENPQGILNLDIDVNFGTVEIRYI